MVKLIWKMKAHKIIQCFNQLTDFFFKNVNSDHISGSKSKRFSDESIKALATSNNNLAPALNHIKSKIRVKFDGSGFTHKQVVNIYIIDKINLRPFTVGTGFDFAL